MQYDEEIQRKEAARARLRARQGLREVDGRQAPRRADRYAKSMDYRSPQPASSNRTAVIVVTAVVIVVLVLIVFAVRGCVSGGASSNSASSSSSDASSSAAVAQSSDQSGSDGGDSSASSASPVDTTPIDEDSLANLLGWDLTNKLLARAETDNDAHWIASHPEEYLEDGSMVQFKLLRLAANEGDSIPFVRNWPTEYCADAPNYDLQGVGDRSSNGVPHLLQWDPRWGYTEYSGTTFALTGCCPTTLAMAYQAVTGKTDKTPYDMGQLAIEMGYMSELNGTPAEFLVYAAPSLGMTCTQIDVYESSLKWALDQHMVVACNVGPGDFTDGGHYIVITGFADNGELMVNDPFSVERSNRTWPVSTLLGQTMGLYAFS